MHVSINIKFKKKIKECLEIWEPQPPGTLGACPGL
jgi:hypothetical protein